ncbi:MAG TPA: class I SAM-dependent methyltransferase [Bryobacteraceae bacterium]|nr:class I SAM-dependent methyltransferase [Bryobacteraceae bacterium]
MNPRELNIRIHPDDQMFLFKAPKDRELAARAYFDTGRIIADTIRQIVSWKFGGFTRVNRFLDFAAGYGRVTRFLVQQIDPSRVWVSDILGEAVEFQQKNLGVHGFVSTREPEALLAESPFDCILVCSLFTHLPEATFTAWLERLYQLLAPGGLLIISTHDEYLRGGGHNTAPMFWFEQVSEIASLDKNEYGSTMVNEPYVRAAIGRATRGTGSYFRIPRGLNRHQDLYLIAGPPAPDFSTLPASLEPQGHVDSISVNHPGLVKISGWACDLSGSVAEVRVLVQGQVVHTCRPDLERTDVARHFENPNAKQCGFSCIVELARDREGDVSMIAVGASGKSSVIYNEPLPTVLKGQRG